MAEDRSALKRKQHRESTLVGRDKASTETVEYMNTLRERIQDPAAAELAAMLHAQVNGDHPDYTRPPKEEPFGHWHADLTVATPTVASTTTDGATVEVSLADIKFYDSPATVFVRFIEQSDGIDPQIVQTTTQTLSDTTTTAEFTTTDLSPSTEYTVQAVAEADVDVQTHTDYSDQVSFATDAV